MPKWIEEWAMRFPTIHFVLIAISTVAGAFLPLWLTLILVILMVYALPLVIWRAVSLKYPLIEGVSYLGIHELCGNPWVVAHRLQYLFITFSFFEKVLILIPGAFSAWLRLWGSKIGKRVVWTPRVDILDRTHLQIGDHAFIGDRAYLASHFIKRKSGRLVLVVKSVRVESKALLGYGCVIGPGSVIPKNETLPALSQALFGRVNKVAEWK